MQDRYVGDIGDFVKLSLLRALTKGQRVGIVWYLVPDEAHNRDGRHVDYLKDSEWRRLDPEIFDCLSSTLSKNGTDPAAFLDAEDWLGVKYLVGSFEGEVETAEVSEGAPSFPDERPV